MGGAGLRLGMEAIGLSTGLGPRWLPAMQAGVVTLETLVDALVAARRTEPGTREDADLLDLLMANNAQGELSDRELADVLIFLFVAGYDTSKNMLTLTFWALLSRPEVYRRWG